MFPGGVTTSAGTCLPPAFPHAASALPSSLDPGSATGSAGVLIPYNPLTGDSHKSYSRSWNDRFCPKFSNVPGTGLGDPPSQLTYEYVPGLMTNVKIHTSTSTKNNTVNAVGNRNRRLGSAPASSGRAWVSVAMLTSVIRW